MNKKQSIQEFLAPKKLAVAGISGNTKKFGYAIFKELREKGFDICPINPKLDEIDGVKVYKSIIDIPDGFEKLFIVTPKSETDAIIKQAAEKGIKHIWVQQTSNTKETEMIAKDLIIELIHKECIFMFAEPVQSIHKFHKAIWKIFGLLPK
ncbi:MAG: CoA-binding protein [Bacteroidales bacterium]|nr:CoA-binding protein [Bacteroidales bacterium]